MSSRSTVIAELRRSREAKQALSESRREIAKLKADAIFEHFTELRRESFPDDGGVSGESEFLAFLASRLAYTLNPEQLEQLLK